LDNSNNLTDECHIFQNQSFDGYTLFAPEMWRYTYLINNNGTIVNMWKSDYIQALGTYLLDNGNLIRTCSKIIPNPNFITGGFTGCVEIFDWNGSLLWDFEYSTDKYCLHHDVEVLPNGNILMIAWEKKNADEAIDAGRNSNDIQMGELWPDHIIEVEPTGPSSGNIVWEWHVWDHLIQDHDSTKENYGIVADHPELIDINFDARQHFSTYADIHHTNSIDYNEELDQILLSIPNFCEIWIIDHSTTIEEAAGHTGGRYGKGGDLLYRWGNPQAYHAGDDNDQVFYNQHDAQWIETGSPGEGNILVFNNGLKRPEDEYSSVEEIIPPLDEYGNYALTPGFAYGPEEPTWIYTAQNQTDFYSKAISGAQRLPNGNTLICEGNNGYFFEVTHEKEIVWEYVNSLSNVRDVFNIHRYSLNYSGIGELKPQKPSKPSKPDGETFVKTSIEYTYTTSSTDPNGDQIYYMWNWGDGTNSGWIGPYNSGEITGASHAWKENGTYEIKVKTKDTCTLESLWSESLNVNVEGLQVWLFGMIDSKTERDNEISFWADKLLLFSLNPFNFETFPFGIHMIVDAEYKGIFTNNIIAGKFSLKE